jgi:hypothetical protein
MIMTFSSGLAGMPPARRDDSVMIIAEEGEGAQERRKTRAVS